MEGRRPDPWENQAIERWRQGCCPPEYSSLVEETDISKLSWPKAGWHKCSDRNLNIRGCEGVTGWEGGSESPTANGELKEAMKKQQSLINKDGMFCLGQEFWGYEHVGQRVWGPASPPWLLGNESKVYKDRMEPPLKMGKLKFQIKEFGVYSMMCCCSSSPWFFSERHPLSFWQVSSMFLTKTHTDMGEQWSWSCISWRPLSLTSICCEGAAVFLFCPCLSIQFDLDMLSKISCTIADLSLNLGEKLACLSVVSGLLIVLFLGLFPLGTTLGKSDNW